MDKHKDRFDLSDTSPANVPVVHVPLKAEYKNRFYYRAEPERSVRDQEVIDRYGKRLLEAKRARLNPQSKHNIAQVIVNRFDKNGLPVKDR